MIAEKRKLFFSFLSKFTVFLLIKGHDSINHV